MGSSETLDGLETRAAEVSGVLDEVVLVFFWPQAEKVMAEAAIETIRRGGGKNQPLKWLIFDGRVCAV